LEHFSEPQKNFLYNQWLEMEVNNGGIDQFFYNSSGELAHKRVESLKAIEALETASLLQEGIDRWPDGRVPKEMKERRDTSLRINPEGGLFADLDKRFSVYEEDRNQLNLEYIRKNHDAF